MTISVQSEQKLLVDSDNCARTYRTATLTDSETETYLDSDRSDELNVHLYVIAGHAHLCALGKADNACNVCCSEVELRTIVVEERSMTATLVLSQYVNLTTELCVGMNRAGLSKNLATLDLCSLNTTEKYAYVVACLSVIKSLSEHLDTCYIYL